MLARGKELSTDPGTQNTFSLVFLNLTCVGLSILSALYSLWVANFYHLSTGPVETFLSAIAGKSSFAQKIQ